MLREKWWTNAPQKISHRGVYQMINLVILLMNETWVKFLPRAQSADSSIIKLYFHCISSDFSHPPDMADKYIALTVFNLAGLSLHHVYVLYLIHIHVYTQGRIQDFGKGGTA